MKIRAHISNLGAYTRGKLRGKWLEMPMDKVELTSTIEEVLDTIYRDEEYFLTDYEAPFSIGEYENIYALNELAEEIEEIDEDDNIVCLIADDVLSSGYDRNELARILKDREYSVVSEVWDEQDLALKADEAYLPFDYSKVKDTSIADYLDWESIGRSMVLDGWILKNGVGIRVYM